MGALHPLSAPHPPDTNTTECIFMAKARKSFPKLRVASLSLSTQCRHENAQKRDGNNPQASPTTTPNEARSRAEWGNQFD